MKLKNGFITQDIDNTQIMVGTGDTNFNGIVRSNSTAAYIVNLLKNDITEQEIVTKMAEKYDTSKEQIEKDVKNILNKLRSISALEE